MLESITTDEAYALIAQNAAEATRHMHMLYVILTSVFVIAMMWRVLLLFERREWVKMTRDGRDYELGRSANSQNLGIGVTPTPRLWQRIVRAFVAFFRKVSYDALRCSESKY